MSVTLAGAHPGVMYHCARCGRSYQVEERELASAEFCPACVEVLADGLLMCPAEPLPPLQ